MQRFSNRAAVAREPVSGLRAVFRGANTNNGGNAGVGAVNVNNAPSNANANIGSPLNNGKKRGGRASPHGERQPKSGQCR